MKENVYGLLNGIEMDLSEYEELELSQAEKEAHKRRILREVNRMGKRKKIGKWKIAAGMAAACAVAFGAVGTANPILAENMFSGVFGKLIGNAKGGKYEEEDVERFTKIGGRRGRGGKTAGCRGVCGSGGKQRRDDFGFGYLL